VRTQAALAGDSAHPAALARIRCPILVCYGTGEPEARVSRGLEAIRRGAGAAARVDTQLIEGAVHDLAGSEVAVAAVIAAWIGSVREASPAG